MVVDDDVIGNMVTLAKVGIFSSRFRPNVLSIKGSKARGMIAENVEGEYVYSALFEDAHAGEKMRIRVFVKGKSTREILKEDGYFSNFAWNTRHVQRIVFPRRWRILSATPDGYVVETPRGLPSIKWNREERFWGDVQVKIKKG